MMLRTNSKSSFLKNYSRSQHNQLNQSMRRPVTMHPHQSILTLKKELVTSIVYSTQHQHSISVFKIHNRYARQFSTVHVEFQLTRTMLFIIFLVECTVSIWVSRCSKRTSSIVVANSCGQPRFWQFSRSIFVDIIIKQ